MFLVGEKLQNQSQDGKLQFYFQYFYNAKGEYIFGR